MQSSLLQRQEALAARKLLRLNYGQECRSNFEHVHSILVKCLTCPLHWFHSLFQIQNSCMVHSRKLLHKNVSMLLFDGIFCTLHTIYVARQKCAYLPAFLHLCKYFFQLFKPLSHSTWYHWANIVVHTFTYIVEEVGRDFYIHMCNLEPFLSYGNGFLSPLQRPWGRRRREDIVLYKEGRGKRFMNGTYSATLHFKRKKPGLIQGTVHNLLYTPPLWLYKITMHLLPTKYRWMDSPIWRMDTRLAIYFTHDVAAIVIYLSSQYMFMLSIVF